MTVHPSLRSVTCSTLARQRGREHSVGKGLTVTAAPTSGSGLTPSSLGHGAARTQCWLRTSTGRPRCLSQLHWLATHDLTESPAGIGPGVGRRPRSDRRRRKTWTRRNLSLDGRAPEVRVQVRHRLALRLVRSCEGHLHNERHWHVTSYPGSGRRGREHGSLAGC